MSVSEIDANIASFDTLDIDTYAGLDKLEEAIGIIDNITNYGITKQDFDSLQKLFPELRTPEFEIGAMPVRLGTQEIGNEVIAGLGTAATIAILTAFAAILGWIISKLFGGGSSSGGGGSAAASVSDLKAMGIPFSAELMIAIYSAQGSESKDRAVKNRMVSRSKTVKNVSIFIEDLNNGSISSGFKLMNGISKGLLELVDSGADDSETLKVVNGLFIKDFAAVISNNTSADMGTIGKKLKMSPVSTLKEFNTNVVKIKPDHYALNYSSTDPKKFPAQIVLKDAGFDNLHKVIKAQETLLDKGIKDLKGKTTNMSKDGYLAVTNGLKVMLAYTRSTLLRQLVAGNKAIDEYRDTMVAYVVGALSSYEDLSPIEKNMVDKEAGLEDGDVKELLGKVKKRDDKALKRSIEVFEAIAKTSKFKDNKEVSTVIDQMKKM